VKIDESRLYCYLPGTVLREALEEQRVLDALLNELEVPGKPGALKRLSPKEKLQAIENQIEHFRTSKTSLWYRVESPEILAASIYRSSLPNGLVLDDFFCDVRSENDLLAPVAAWLEEQRLEAIAEVPMSRKRIDVIGLRRPGLLRRAHVVGVELKSEIRELDRALDQMTTFAEYANRLYLACTPALAAQYLDCHAESRGVRHWDPNVFDRKLERLGFGLLLVEDDEVFEHLEPKSSSVDRRKLDELLAIVAEKSAT